eukprot:scaffold12081_cov82-Skeletonema_marinoi.AAC.1
MTNTRASRSPKRQSSKSDRKSSKKKSTGNQTEFTATVESALKDLPAVYKQTCPGLKTCLETLPPRLITIAIGHLKSMSEINDKIDHKLKAIDDFTNKKSVINGVETIYQPNSIQRKHPLTVPAVLMNNQEANGLMDEANKLQEELNVKLVIIPALHSSSRGGFDEGREVSLS